MESPLVSICCITYNHEPYIKDALDGFVMQKTNFPFEIVISDDCSKDRTREIIAEYKAKYPDLIRDVSPKKNMGSSANFIYVQQCAKGRYIAVCEGDDYWTDSQKLQKQVNILEREKTLMACCTDCSIVDNNNSVLEEKRGNVVKDDIEGKYNLRDFFKDNHQYPTLTMVYRNVHKDDIAAMYAHTQNKYLGDWTLWIILLIYGDIFYLNEATAAYRINPTSLTHTVNRIARVKASRDICHKVADILPEEYTDIAVDLRDTRWVWISLIFAYRAEKRYFGMIWSLIMASILCPNSLLGVWKNRKRK